MIYSKNDIYGLLADYSIEIKMFQKTDVVENALSFDSSDAANAEADNLNTKTESLKFKVIDSNAISTSEITFAPLPYVGTVI